MKVYEKEEQDLNYIDITLEGSSLEEAVIHCKLQILMTLLIIKVLLALTVF